MLRLVVRFVLLPLALTGLSSAVHAANFGAVAYSDSTGDYGYSFDYRTAKDATDRAIHECEKPSGAQDCVMIKGVGTSRADRNCASG